MAIIRKSAMDSNLEIHPAKCSKFKKKARGDRSLENKKQKTGQIVDGDERGRSDAVWVSTAAHGSTVFWKHPADCITAMGGKTYK